MWPEGPAGGGRSPWARPWAWPWRPRSAPFPCSWSFLWPSAFSGQRSAVSTSPRTTHYAYCALIATLAAAGAVFFLAQPYALIDWPTFLDDTLRESQIAWGTLDVPYTRQYAGTLPYLYSMWQTALWGLGLPLGLVAWAGFAAALVRWLRRGAWTDTLLLAWAGPYLALTGLLHTRYLRYMLPLVPVLCILAVSLAVLSRSGQRSAAAVVIGSLGLGPCSLAYSLLFVGIYAEPHPWIAASRLDL